MVGFLWVTNYAKINFSLYPQKVPHARDFLFRGVMMQAEEDRAMAVGLKAFLEELAEDEKNPPRCPSCNNPFEPRVDGVRRKFGGIEVCDDCYYDAWAEIDEHSVVRPRAPHGAH